jgi:hypothetical protein
MKTKHDWPLLLAAFEGSGLTHPKFCELHGVSLDVFRRKLYASRRKHVPGPKGFTRIALGASIPRLPGVELHFPNGSFLRFTGEVGPSFLRADHRAPAMIGFTSSQRYFPPPPYSMHTSSQQSKLS